MVCLSVVSTVFVISISAKNEAVPRWVQIIFLRHLARFTGMYRKEFDDCDCREPEHTSELVKHTIKVHQNENGSALPPSVMNDVRFLRTNLEEKNVDDLNDQKWKHIGLIIDAFLLMIFSIVLVIASVTLITRAGNDTTSLK